MILFTWKMKKFEKISTKRFPYDMDILWKRLAKVMSFAKPPWLQASCSLRDYLLVLNPMNFMPISFLLVSYHYGITQLWLAIIRKIAYRHILSILIWSLVLKISLFISHEFLLQNLEILFDPPLTKLYCPCV